MRIHEILSEGGWDSTVTQGTVINPHVVQKVLNIVQRFVSEFNQYLASKGIEGKIEMGRPTGSGAYHEIDQQNDPEKVYGDVDLQMICPNNEGMTAGQVSTYWNQLVQQFFKETTPEYVHPEETKPGHPIIKIGKDSYVQVDFMWHESRLKDWGAARVTPEHNVKGLLQGNMYSVFGELLNMSIQHAGVQLKVADGKVVPFSKQKGVTLVTVTTDPANWILDTFKYLVKQSNVEKPRIDPDLKVYAGTDISNVKIQKLAKGIQAFARSCDKNNMFGQGILEKYRNADEFLTAFINRYEEKAMIDVAGKKRDKAETPAAIARAESDRKKVLDGLEKVKSYFATEITTTDI
jgi:hypothetical protein